MICQGSLLGTRAVTDIPYPWATRTICSIVSDVNAPCSPSRFTASNPTRAASSMASVDGHVKASTRALSPWRFFFRIEFSIMNVPFR